MYGKAYIKYTFLFLNISLSFCKGHKSLGSTCHSCTQETQHGNRSSDDIIYTEVGSTQGIQYQTGGI